MSHAIREPDGLWTRRHWLQATGGLTVGATLARTLPAADSDKPPAPLMQIGILMGTFARPTLEARLDAVKACGLDCVQLSMGCAGLPAMPDEIPPELVARIRREADARGITIASLEGTFNMSHPDAEHRRTGCGGCGCWPRPASRWARRRSICVPAPAIATACGGVTRTTIRRKPGGTWWPASARRPNIAQQAGVVLAFEPEVNNVVDSAQKARRLMDEIGSPHLKVTMDAANIFHAGELARMSEMLDQAFALIGKDIVLAHAKDLSRDGDAGHEAAGHGKLDYDRYLSLLHAYGFQGPLLLHGLSEAQVPGCVAFLREKLARVAAVPAKSVPGAG